MNDMSWHSARRLGIGGSDVGPILGLSSWATPLDIYRQKIGEVEPEPDNATTKWGRMLEPVVRQEYADRTGHSVIVPSEPLVHPKYPFMRVNLDGRVLPTAGRYGRLYEGKTARFDDDWGDEGTDQVPAPYLFQCQHGMCITGDPVADIAVLMGVADVRIYTIEADREIHEMLIEQEHDFWQLVQNRTPPPPKTTADAVKLWGRISKSRSVVAGDDEVAAIKELLRLGFELQRTKDLIEDQRLIVMGAMGEADRLVTPRGGTLATWRTQNTARGEARVFKLR